MEIVLVRAANVFGPYARFDPSTSNFLPALIRKAVERLDPFPVWGSPDVVRDVIYSADFASDCVGLLAPMSAAMFSTSARAAGLRLEKR